MAPILNHLIDQSTQIKKTDKRLKRLIKSITGPGRPIEGKPDKGEYDRKDRI